MRASCEEGSATRFDFEPYAEAGDNLGVASARGTGRPALEPPCDAKGAALPCADPVVQWGRRGTHGSVRSRYGECLDDTVESQNPSMSGHSKRENWKILSASGPCGPEPLANASGGKPDGRQPPIGIAALEEKLVQQAVLWVFQAVYEQDFLGFSYGFRPGRGCLQALDVLTVAIRDQQLNGVLDADIQGFFDTIDHMWLFKCIEHGSAIRREMVGDDCRHAAGSGPLTAPGERVPALRHCPVIP